MFVKITDPFEFFIPLDSHFMEVLEGGATLVTHQNLNKNMLAYLQQSCEILTGLISLNTYVLSPEHVTGIEIKEYLKVSEERVSLKLANQVARLVKHQYRAFLDQNDIIDFLIEVVNHRLLNANLAFNVY